MLKKFCAAISLAACSYFGAAHAAILTGNLTVDDQFTAYISTNDSVAGTVLASGANWPSVQSFSTSLNPGQTYYLHIAGNDLFGVISAFLGSFNLSGDALFSNGTQSLVTNTTNWQVSTTGFGSGYTTPTGLGTNGVAPWGTLSSIASNAEWIWSSNQLGVAFFTTTITTGNSVPEPASYFLMLTCLGLMAAVARRHSQRS